MPLERVQLKTRSTALYLVGSLCSDRHEESNFWKSFCHVQCDLCSPTSPKLLFNAQAVETSGNPLAHAILRGGLDASGKNIPNYHYEDLLAAANAIAKWACNIPSSWWIPTMTILAKQFEEQVRIVRETMMNRAWNKDLATLVRGFMIESHLEDGRQNEPVVYGPIHHNPCLGWEKHRPWSKEIATMNK